MSGQNFSAATLATLNGPLSAQPSRAYSNGRRARGTVDPVVFWLNPLTSELMLAPHTDLRPFRGFVRIEANTPREIERLSRALALQEESKMRGMAIKDHLRQLKRWEAQRARIRLHMAAGVKSRADEIACKRILANIERRERTLYALIHDSKPITDGALVIEQREAPVGMAANHAKSTSLDALR